MEEQLKIAITAVEGIAAVAAVMVVGDYLGYKLGRWRLATYAGIVTLGAIVLYAIYAAIVLNTR